MRGVAAIAGIVITPPHLGHFAFLPAALARTRMFVPHPHLMTIVSLAVSDTTGPPAELLVKHDIDGPRPAPMKNPRICHPGASLLATGH